MLKILGANVSPFVRKVRVYLAEKNIPYELQPVNPFTAGPEYRKISPLGKIPAMQDGDVTLADSSVICAYLEKKNPHPPLFPADPVEYGRALFALKLTKEAVNVAEDAQGRVQAMQTSFALHQLAHTHWLKLYNMLLDPTGLPPETQKALGIKSEKKS